MSVITLLSDFGSKDPYVAEMKAVILSINSEASVVDITHEVDKFNIRMGAFILASATPYFPPNTVHVAVVDPGVGTKRRSIIVETKRGFYVGPDNGLLMLAAQKEGIIKVYHIDNPKYMLSRVSRTFHGRDIFAPAAAHLAAGTGPSEFGPAIQDYVFPEFVKPQAREGEVVGEVLHIDDFGNIVSNISVEDLQSEGFHKGDSLLVRLGDKTLILQFCSAYGEVPDGTALALVGSSDFIEVALNQGSASKTFKAEVGEPFRISGAASN
ncbi:MAG: S-adenosyl-l-methionine hydroxide adenosyltransferase family protein [Candidatus Bathyarchaeum sp.]|nr:MAG: S-adenosyl-l-methionine hydroxide adenosyltransferase family protein [Candidatus Bathyarchaeum sp.]